MSAAAQKDVSKKTEFAVGRRHTPDFAWPTIVLAAVLFTAFAASTYFAVTDALPLTLAVSINSAVIYALYTVVHEAVHANISSRRRHLRWVDTVLGVTACVPLWLFFHQHKKQHMMHHAKTNRDDDPDIYSRGSFLGWCVRRLPVELIGYFNPVKLHEQCKAYNLSTRETRITMASFAAYALLAAAVIAAGYGFELLVLWLVPWWIGQFVMLTLFTWAPHHDHTETGRYRNTRVSLWPGAELLLLGQNLHLIHHMIPSIPYYRYKPTFDELRPILERKGARIEGFWPQTATPVAQAS